MNSTSVLNSRAQAREQLRHRAVLYDADARDALFERSKWHRLQRPHLTEYDASVLLPFPRLLARAQAGQDFPRVRTGSKSDAAACSRRINAMRTHAGELVLMTLRLDDLNGFDLKTDVLTLAARRMIDTALEKHAPNAPAYDVAVQRGGRHDGTHAHIVLPLFFLRADIAATAISAPAGKGGGARYSRDLHVVRIKDTAKDRTRVASYQTRDPDSRFALRSDDPAFLQAHEEELARKKSGNRSRRLSWFKLPNSWRSIG